MDRRTRICVWVIVLGLANFAAYMVGYGFVGAAGGDAMNGRVVRDAADPGHIVYFIGRGGDLHEVGRGVWIYSAAHSISIWPTIGIMMLAMLTLAKDRLVASMRSTIVRGRTFIRLVAVLIVIFSAIMTRWFVLYAMEQLSDPKLVDLLNMGPCG